jgi:hypothetical protein
MERLYFDDVSVRSLVFNLSYDMVNGGSLLARCWSVLFNKAQRSLRVPRMYCLASRSPTAAREPLVDLLQANHEWWSRFLTNPFDQFES